MMVSSVASTGSENSRLVSDSAPSETRTSWATATMAATPLRKSNRNAMYATMPARPNSTA